ncbi:MAG: MFS transporter [Pelovirga sp.]
MKLPSFIAENPSLALFALLATAFSGFGQTFFISVFGSFIRDAFTLSNSHYGFYYGGATLLSALLLLKIGGLVDRKPLWQVTLMAILLLSSGCLLIGIAPHWMLLIPGFLLIRLGGQAMLSHLGVTVAGRYFTYSRGKIMALTVAGFPLAEATLPLGAGILLLYGQWRLPWLVAVAVLLLVALPLLLYLARTAPHPQSASNHQSTADQNSLTRAEVLRDAGFYMLLPAALANPFSVTAVLFHQATLVDLRNWPAEQIGLAFTGFAVGHLASLLIAGPIIDRFGAQRTLPVALLPLLAGLLVLTSVSASWALFVYLLLTGSSLGCSGAAGGALWPERYGTRHLGAIRSVAQAVMVVSTATAPVVVGLLLDLSHSTTWVGLFLSAGVAAAIILAWSVKPAAVLHRKSA